MRRLTKLEVGTTSSVDEIKICTTIALKVPMSRSTKLELRTTSSVDEIKIFTTIVLKTTDVKVNEVGTWHFGTSSCIEEIKITGKFQIMI